VRFAFAPETLQLRDAVRLVLARECTAARVRAAWASDDARVPGLWTHLGTLGVPGMLAPVDDGGLGLTEVELVLVLEDSGRYAVPEPVVDVVAVGVPLLRDARSPALRAVASGERIAAVQLPGAPFVVGAGAAHVLVLQHDGEVHVVDRSEVTLEAHPSVDGSRRLHRVRWSPSKATRLLDGDEATPLLADAVDRAAVGFAAQLVGLARAMIDRTVDYVKARHQFGKPVGSFQAVKHHLADALVAVEMAAPSVYRAAWSLAHRAPGRAVHASMAKALASDAAALAARKALQCHGAIGYAYENDLHLWMKRAWALGADAPWHRARVERAIFEDGGT
jgi:alkylation response protein AidB-like acyl-CoA dehydrogenase